MTHVDSSAEKVLPKISVCATELLEAAGTRRRGSFLYHNQTPLFSFSQRKICWMLVPLIAMPTLERLIGGIRQQGIWLLGELAQCH